MLLEVDAESILYGIGIVIRCDSLFSTCIFPVFVFCAKVA